MCNHHQSSPYQAPATAAISRRAALRAGLGVAAIPLVTSCERLASWVVSDEAVERLGVETWERLRAQMPPTEDREARQRVAGVAYRLLVAAGEDPSRWELEVFAQPDVNAFVLPGRKIGVLEGMLRVATDNAEIAAVVGHEIGHLQADHSQERLTAEVVRQSALLLISLALQINDIAFAREIAAVLGVGLEFGLVRPYSRRQELEADRLGIFTMAKAGYDPRLAAELWRKMDGAVAGRPPAFLSTHPAPAARIEAIEALIPEAIAAAETSGVAVQ